MDDLQPEFYYYGNDQYANLSVVQKQLACPWVPIPNTANSIHMHGYGEKEFEED